MNKDFSRKCAVCKEEVYFYETATYIKDKGNIHNKCLTSELEKGEKIITVDEMLSDIRKMLIVLSAVTDRNSEGAELLEEWLVKYKRTR